MRCQSRGGRAEGAAGMEPKSLSPSAAPAAATANWELWDGELHPVGVAAGGKAGVNTI